VIESSRQMERFVVRENNDGDAWRLIHAQRSSGAVSRHRLRKAFDFALVMFVLRPPM
jgi:hypothetical protein